MGTERTRPSSESAHGNPRKRSRLKDFGLRRFMHVSFALGALSTIGCTPEAEPPAERLASVSQPTWNGTLAGATQFKPVAAWLDGAGTAKCTATLITPSLMLSARHCAGPATVLDQNVQFRFGTFHEGFIVTHTAVASNGAVGPMVSPSNVEIVGAGDPAQAARDILLIPLDAPVPSNIAIPVAPMHLVGGCENTFPDGTMVGYGSDSADPSCGSQLDWKRFTFSSGWSRGTAVDVGEFFFRPSPTNTLCTTFHGVSHGDSGGPLFRGDESGTLLLCGVASGWSNDGTTFQDRYAAVDSAQANAWLLAQILKSPAGCGVVDATNDPDGDGIPTICDNCPTVWNPEQLTGTDDKDGDGVGAACDYCPDDAVKDQTFNCNFESELATAYQTLSIPGNTSVGKPVVPVLRRDAFPTVAAFEAQKAILLQTIKPDYCDPNPCPDHLLTSDSGQLDKLPPIDPLVDCHTPPCSWDIHNKIVLTPHVTPKMAQLQPQGTPGKVGLRWCYCDDASAPTDTLAGRAKCHISGIFKCSVDSTAYDTAGTRWKSIASWDGVNWSASSSGVEWSLQFAPVAGTSAFAWWDFTKLGIGVGLDPDPNAKNTGTHGILWSHISKLDTPPTTEANAEKFGNIYGEGNASRSYGQSKGTPATVNFWEAYYCPECPVRYTSILVERGNPTPFQLMEQGPIVAHGLSAGTLSFYADLAAGAVSYVHAAEPLGRLAQATPPAAKLVRGVTFDQTGHVAGILTSAAIDEGGAPSSFVPTGGPVIGAGMGTVVSGALRRLFAFGGTNRGTANATAWTLDLSAGTWTEYAVPSGERPGTILAATFRLDDQRVYFVDAYGSYLRLCRFRASSAQVQDGVEVLAQFPAEWTPYSRFSLVAGAEGDLLFSTSNHATDSSKDALLARFSVLSTGKLAFSGRRIISSKTVGEPVLTGGGIAVGMVQGSTFVLKTIAVGSLDPAALDAPILF